MGHTLTSSTYTALSQLNTVSAGGNTSSATYNPNLTLNSVTGSNSDTVTWNYSSYRPTTVYNPDGSHTSYSYSDGSGGQAWNYPYVATVSSPMGKVTRTVLDGFGRTIQTSVQETSATWITTLTQYSACSCSGTGKAVKTSGPFRSDANANPNSGETIYWTTTLSDALGRTVSVTAPSTDSNFPNGVTTTYTYSVQNDSNWQGTLTQTTLPITTTTSRTARYLYDAFGKLLRVDQPATAGSVGTLLPTATYVYDALGHMITANSLKADTGNNAILQTRTFTYNSKGQMTAQSLPEYGKSGGVQRSASYVYNDDGTLANKTKPDGTVLYYAYDDKHRLTSVSSPQNTVKTSFSYDTATNGTGKMASASNDGYTWNYAYDVMGRIVTQDLVNPDSSYSEATYGYDSDGNLTSLNYPTGQQYQYTNDQLGRPQSMAVSALDGNGNQFWNTRASNASYDDFGHLTSYQETVHYWQMGIGWFNWSATFSKSYDPARGWMTGQSDVNSYTPLWASYNYLANGQVSSVSYSTATAQSASYGYL